MTAIYKKMLAERRINYSPVREAVVIAQDAVICGQCGGQLCTRPLDAAMV